MFLQIMKYALFSSFKDRAKGLCRIIMDISTGIFFFTVINPAVRSKLLSNFEIGFIVICH